MKRLALVAAVLVIAACTTKQAATDTAKDTSALAPAPAMSDTTKVKTTTKTKTTTTTTKKP